MVLVEALVRGVPIVASDCPHGPRDIVQPQVNGWLFPPGDVVALRDILWNIVSSPHTLPDAVTVRSTAQRFLLTRVVDGMLAAMVGFPMSPRCDSLKVKQGYQ